MTKLSDVLTNNPLIIFVTPKKKVRIADKNEVFHIWISGNANKYFIFLGSRSEEKDEEKRKQMVFNSMILMS